MADRIKGITVEIGGDTTGLSKALGTVTQQQYDAWQREIIETENELKNLEQQCKETDSHISATLTATGTKLQEVGGKISDVGTGLTTHVTAPIVALGAASLAAFNEVDAGLDIVEQKTGATGEALEEMNQIVKDLATEIPTDFETAGAAVGEVNTRFGLTGQALDDLSAKFIKFAQLNDTDVSTSIDNVSSVMNAFGMDASEADSLLDALNATGQATGIGMDSLASLLSSNAVQLKEMGLTAQQAAGFMGMVEMSGLDTSSAMMGLKTAMKNATKDGKTLDQALADFSQTMKGNGSETEKLQAAYDLFGSKAGASIYNAVQTGKLNLDDLSGSLSDFEGSVENTFNATLDPIDQFQMTMNSLKETGAEVGNSLMTVLAPVLKQISDKLKSLAEWWNNLGEPMQQMIIKIALVATAIGPLLVVIGKIVSSVGTVMTIIPKVSTAITTVKGAMSGLNATLAANPIGLVIAAIAALVAAFIYLWKTNEDFRNKITAIWNGLVETFQAFTQGIVDKLNELGFNFKDIGEVIKAVWDGLCSVLAPMFEGVFQNIANILSYAMDLILNILDVFIGIFTGDWDQALSGINGIFTSTWDFIVNTLSNILTTLGNVVNVFLGWFGTSWQEIWQGIKDFFVNIWNGIVSFFTGIVTGIQNTVTTVFTAISTFFTNIWNGIKTFFETILNGIKTAVTTYFNAYKTVITTVLTAIQTVVTTVWNAIKIAITTVVNAIKTAITTAWNAIKTTTSTVFNAVKTTVSNIWNGIKSAVMNVINTMKSGISNGFNAIKSTVSNIVNGIKSTISNVFNGIWSFVSGIVNKLKSVFNFSWSLPKIKLPHFSISGSFSLNPPSIPHFSVDWYKKAMSGGMILKDATIFGQSGGTLLGGGEAGDEAVVGVSSLRSMIQDAVSSASLSLSGDHPLINIEEMSVRSDDDIRKISQQLNTLLTAGRRAKGLV